MAEFKIRTDRMILSQGAGEDIEQVASMGCAYFSQYLEDFVEGVEPGKRIYLEIKK